MKPGSLGLKKEKECQLSQIEKFLDSTIALQNQRNHDFQLQRTQTGLTIG
jgi:hypothetical protein